MKTAVVYYSLEGNTDYVAKTIAKELDADLIRLEAKKEFPKKGFRKFFWGGKSVVFKEEPTLLPYEFDVDHYDQIVVGTPLWAGSYASPIATFLKENKISNKKVAMFICKSGSPTDKCIAKFQKEAGVKKLLATMVLIDPYVHKSADNIQQIQEFIARLR